MGLDSFVHYLPRIVFEFDICCQRLNHLEFVFPFFHYEEDWVKFAFSRSAVGLSEYTRCVGISCSISSISIFVLQIIASVSGCFHSSHFRGGQVTRTMKITFVYKLITSFNPSYLGSELYQSHFPLFSTKLLKMQRPFVKCHCFK